MTKEGINKHWEIIKAYKEGKTIQYNSTGEGWITIDEPQFYLNIEYRVKHIHYDIEQAFKEGKTIQMYSTCNNIWTTISDPVFYADSEYRVKPEPCLPTSWKELEEIDGYYTNAYSKKCSVIDVPTDTYNYTNVFPTKEEAQASIALAQLCQLRDRYNDGWKADFTEGNVKYAIVFYKDKILYISIFHTKYVLVFKTRELRDLFLENFKDLIEEAKPLL